MTWIELFGCFGITWVNWRCSSFIIQNDSSVVVDLSSKGISCLWMSAVSWSWQYGGSLVESITLAIKRLWVLEPCMGRMACRSGPGRARILIKENGPVQFIHKQVFVCVWHKVALNWNTFTCLVSPQLVTWFLYGFFVLSFCKTVVHSVQDNCHCSYFWLWCFGKKQFSRKHETNCLESAFISFTRWAGPGRTGL